MGYFANSISAQRYAEYRPYFHPAVMERIKEVCNLPAKLNTALDVACGTGQSAVALRSLAHNVIATDIALEMLAHAEPDTDITYIQSDAEHLPVVNNSADLITVSLAFHWFDRHAFLGEANRVLRPTSCLVIYNNFFYGPRYETPAFFEWQITSYPHRYPPPSRDFTPLTDDEAQQHGFAFIARETYTNFVTFTPESLSHYLMTQSNILAALNANADTAYDIYHNVLTEVQPLFTAPTMIFRFDGPIWFLRKVL